MSLCRPEPATGVLPRALARRTGIGTTRRRMPGRSGTRGNIRGGDVSDASAGAGWCPTRSTDGFPGACRSRRAADGFLGGDPGTVAKVRRGCGRHLAAELVPPVRWCGTTPTWTPHIVSTPATAQQFTSTSPWSTSTPSLPHRNPRPAGRSSHRQGADLVIAITHTSADGTTLEHHSRG